MEIGISTAFLIGIALISIAIFLNIYRNRINRVVYSLLSIFILVLLLEIFLFNFTSYKLIFGNYQEEYFNINDMNLNNIKTGKSEDSIKISNQKDASFELLDLNCNIGTIKIDLDNIDNYNVRVYYSDETSKEYFKTSLPIKTITNSYERSKYIACSFSGNVSKLKIQLEGIEKTSEIKVNEISVNINIPIVIEIYRILIIYLFLVFLYSILNLNIFKSPYNSKNIIQNVIFLLIVFLTSFIIFKISNINDEFYFNENYTHKLVDALISGNVYLDVDVSDKLKQLDNPYDIGQRENVYYIWDLAYYKGKYYVYFGVIPALLIFVPYKIITGKYLTLTFVGMICSIIGNVFLALLIKKIFKKYLKEIPYGILIMSYIVILFGSGLLWLDSLLVLYEFVIVIAFMFTMVGMYLFFSAINNMDKVNYVLIFLACVCLALAVGCRPTFLFYSVVILPIIVRMFFDDIKNNKKWKLTKLIFSVGVPYISIGCFLGIYNYIRFENFFEFGTSYQLTVNDIGALEIRPYAWFIGGMQYLFSSLNLSWEFPFIGFTNINLKYYSYLYRERLIAGGIWMSPIIVCSLLSLNLKKYILFSDKIDKEVYRSAIYMVIIAIILICINSTIGGIIVRYSFEFMLLFNMSAVLIFSLIFKSVNNENIKKFLTKMFFWCMVWTIFLSLMSAVFLGGDGKLKTKYPELYYHIKYVISFWE